jgi:protein-S-isoprenylcysteine O-methyltransferase Ste14
MPTVSHPTLGNAKLADRYALFGMIFQIPMMAVFMVLLFAFRDPAAGDTLFRATFTLPGAALFIWCLWTLYWKRGRTSGLITTGPFRYTRHPMYLGLFVMSWVVFVSPPAGITPYLAYAGWLGLLVAAGYCQERETLARFPDAQAYYAQTPRVPFLI